MVAKIPIIVVTIVAANNTDATAGPAVFLAIIIMSGLPGQKNYC
jgi:hypothetical protein